jgi:hypothetical protein
MTLTAGRAVAGLVLFSALSGCGSAGEQARWASGESTASPSPSPSSAVAASGPAAATGDLTLRLVKVDGLPSCTIIMSKAPGEFTAFPYLGIAFRVDGLPNEGGARVAVTSSAADTLDEVTKLNSDGTLNHGKGLKLDEAPKVTYYAYPADLRQLVNKTVPITITVDPDNEVDEANERNNVLKLRLTARGVQGPPELTKGYPRGAGNRCAKVS